MKNELKIEDLRWIRVFTPDHIPRYLVEQVRDRAYDIDDFYKYHAITCISSSDEGPALNPFSHIYVLSNPENMVKGFVWFVIDPLTKDIVIQTYSIDKEYWYKGRAVKKLADYIKDFRKKGKFNRIFWITNYPKHSERNGFKRSKSVLMEYKEEQDGPNTTRRNATGSTDRSVNTRAEEIPGRDTSGLCATGC